MQQPEALCMLKFVDYKGQPQKLIIGPYVLLGYYFELPSNHNLGTESFGSYKQISDFLSDDYFEFLDTETFSP